MDKEIMDQMDRGLAKAAEEAKKSGSPLRDMLFTLSEPGKEQARSIEEINAQGEVMPFLCVPVTWPSMIPNCHRMICDGCGQQVWMSPATRLVFDKVAKPLVICVDCLKKQMDKHEQPTSTGSPSGGEAGGLRADGSMVRPDC